MRLSHNWVRFRAITFRSLADPALDEITIRRARDEDRQSMWEVHTQSIRSLCGEAYKPQEISAWVARLSQESYSGVLKTQAMFVAEVDQRVVGFGQLDPEKGEVKALYVLPEKVNVGVGSSLLSKMEGVAREHGLTCLRLFSTLNAESFYEGKGYQRRALSKHVINEEVAVDCVLMEKLLS